MTLSVGGNAPLNQTTVAAQITLPSGADIDVTALVIYPGGKVRGDDDMCFYGQPTIANGAVTLSQGSTPSFSFDLNRLPSDADKVVLTATVDGQKTFGQLGDVTISAGGHTLIIPGQGRSERALILAEIYRRNGTFKIRNVGQGFDGGLKALAEHFGVDIADDPAPAAPPPPAPTPKPAVNLGKVSLTKTSSTVSLEKPKDGFGKIRVNLDWNQGSGSGITSLFKQNKIDLDLGAFIEFDDGHKDVVQALGERFGSYAEEPYIQLLEDDRTGSLQGGEWLEINGAKWANIRRILIFAFVYEGVSDWRKTDGVVRILIDGQGDVEVRMNEYGSTLGTCAVAELKNNNGQITVNRLVEFFRNHRDMDDRFNWGFRWTAGSK